MTAFLPNTVSSMTVANRLAYADDSSYYLLCAPWKSLTRTVSWSARQICSPSAPSSPIRRWLWWIRQVEALAVSISEKACVDMALYEPDLSGKTKEELAGELQGVIFRVPGQLEQDGTPHYVTADEYLSGNVRRKLRQAQRAAQQDPALCSQCGSPHRRPAQRPGCVGDRGASGRYLD